MVDVDNVKEYIGKKVKLILKHKNYELNGYIKSVDGTTIKFLDKFSKIVFVEVELIEAIIPLSNGSKYHNGG